MSLSTSKSGTSQGRAIAVCRWGFVHLSTDDHEANPAHAIQVAFEMWPEVRSPRKERPQLLPVLLVNLLGQHAAARNHYPRYFTGVEFLVPVEDKIERLIGEREGKAVGMSFEALCALGVEP